MTSLEQIDQTDSSSDLAIKEYPQFSQPESLIINMILLSKAKHGMTARIHGIANRNIIDEESKGSIIDIYRLYELLTHKDYIVIKEIAKCLGISDKRYEEINDFVYSNEDTL